MLLHCKACNLAGDWPACICACLCATMRGVQSHKRGARADLPAPGTNDVYRVCTPFPFEANLTVTAAQRDMELHIDNFEAFVYFSPGTGRASPAHMQALGTCTQMRCASPAACLQRRAVRR